MEILQGKKISRSNNIQIKDKDQTIYKLNYIQIKDQTIYKLKIYSPKYHKERERMRIYLQWF